MFICGYPRPMKSFAKTLLIENITTPGIKYKNGMTLWEYDSPKNKFINQLQTKAKIRPPTNVIIKVFLDANDVNLFRSASSDKLATLANKTEETDWDTSHILSEIKTATE